MVINSINVLQLLMRTLLKLVGITSEKLEIEPGTTLNFWLPTHSINNKNKSNNHNKPVLVFVHGFCANGLLTWFFQMLAFAKDYDIYVPDLLFFGDSITKSPERSVGFQAECLAKGLKLLGVKRCTIIGFSYGGQIGFKLAKLRPELVESLVVSGTEIELTESITSTLLQRIGFSCLPEFLLPETVEGVKRLLTVGSYNFLQLPYFAYKHFLETMYTNRKERVELLEASIIKDEDAMSPYYPQKIDLLCGDGDKIFNLEVAYTMKKRLGGNSRVHCIRKVGHILQFERPFTYNTCLRKILVSHEAADNKLN